MSTGDMIQIHMLTAYPATLLNRDDTGRAKRIRFGDSVRTRVSSQCLKKHWRDEFEAAALGPVAVRSTHAYQRLVADPLREEDGATPEEAQAIAEYLVDQTVDTKVKQADGELLTGQLLVLTRAETDFLRTLAREVLESGHAKGLDVTKPAVLKKAGLLDKDTLKKVLPSLAASIDTAMFGRMVTSDLFARVDSAVSVAHALTTHAEIAEIDYFTAIDNLKTDADDAGAGLIQDTELTAGIFYLYAVVDVVQLRSNLGGDEALTDRLTRHLIRTMATRSPGAKRGSTAPYAYAEFVLLERGTEQPRTLANAFLKPVQANGAGQMTGSVKQLLAYLSRVDEMYGSAPQARAMATIHEVTEPTNSTLDGAIETILPSGT